MRGVHGDRAVKLNQSGASGQTSRAAGRSVHAARHPRPRSRALALRATYALSDLARCNLRVQQHSDIVSRVHRC